jgi:hypothetical protein
MPQAGLASSLSARATSGGPMRVTMRVMPQAGRPTNAASNGISLVDTSWKGS